MEGKNFLIVGSGRSILDQGDDILEFMSRHNLVTIGINNMTSFVTPDFHLWTNKKQFSTFHKCIKKESQLLFGSGMPKKLIRKHYSGDYRVINYEDSPKLTLSIHKNKITGSFRTAGTLAIAIAHSWNSKARIFVVGMDGYTLHPKKNLQSGSSHHHCYGRGYTDDAGWEKCTKKDALVYAALRKLHKYGVKFQIITETKFMEFHGELDDIK